MVQDDFERNYFLKDIPLQAAQDKYNNHLNEIKFTDARTCLLYTSPSPRDGLLSRMPSSA